MAKNKKTISIEFSTSFNPQDLAKLAQDFKKAINMSDANKQIRDSANKYVGAIIEASAEIEKLKNKGSLDSADIKNLNKFTNQLESNMSNLNKSLNEVGAQPTEQMKGLQKVFNDFEVKSKESAKRIKGQFKGALDGIADTSKIDLSGINFDNALNKIDQFKTELKTLTTNADANLAVGMASTDPAVQTAAKKEHADQMKRAAELQKKIAIVSATYKEFNGNLKRSITRLDQEKTKKILAAEAAQEMANSQFNIIKNDLGNELEEQSAGITQLNTDVDMTTNSFAQASASQEAFGDTIGAIGTKIKQVTSVIFIMRQAFRTLKDSVSSISAIDKQMTEIGIVSKQTNEELWDTFDTFNKLAKDLSSTTLQYLEGAKIFYQQGYELAEVIDLVNATTKAATLSSVSFREASETLTAAIRAFNMEASQATSITDKFAAVGAFSAADFHELSVAMEKVASSAYSAGMSFDYTLGMLAKGVETTKEAPEAIGTALKTIIARFQEMKENPLAQLEDGVDANRVEKALKTIGVSLRDSAGEFRNLDDVFSDLGEKWSGLSRNQKAYIATMSAGMRQQSRFMAMMNNYDRTLELVRMSTNSAGEANRQYAIYTDSVEAAQNRLKNSQEAFYASITSSDAIKLLYDTLSGVLDIFTALNPTILAVVGGIGFLTAMTLKYIVTKQFLNSTVVAGSLADKLAHSTRLKSIASALGLAKAQGLQAGTATAATVATASLTAAMLLLVAAVAILVVTIVLIVKAIQKHNDEVFKAAGLARKNADAKKEETQTLKNQLDRYEELNKVINKSNEEKTELKEITDQIIDQHPELLGGINAEGEAYLKANENLETYLHTKQLAAQQAEIEAYETWRAGAKEAEWDASLEKGAVGQGTVDASQAVQQRLDSTSQIISRETTSSAFSVEGSGTYYVASRGISQMKKRLAESYLKGEYAGSLKDLESELKDLNFNEADEGFKESQEAVNKEIENLISTIEHYETIRLAETRTSTARGLYSQGAMVITELEMLNEDISNEYKDFIATLATGSTEIAESLTADDLGISEEEFSKISKADLVLDYSQHIHTTMMEAAETLREEDGFQEALEELNELKLSGASAKEMEDAGKELLDPFLEGASEGGKDAIEVLRKEFFDVDEFDKMMESVYEHIGESIEKADIPILQENLKESFKNMGSSLHTLVSESLQGMDNGELKDQFLEIIPQIFDGGEFQETFEKELSNLDLNNPTAVKDFTDKLIKQFLITDPDIDEEIARQMAENLISQSSQIAGNFLKIAQETYSTISKITELQSKSLKEGLSLADALKAAEESGIQSLSFVGQDAYTLNYSELENKKREAELKLLNELQNETLNLEKQKIKLNDLSGTALKNAERENAQIDQQISQYQQLTSAIIEVTKAEQARIENQNVLTGISGINAQIGSLKEFGSVYEKLNEGSLSFLDTLEEIGNNPDLIMALELTNNGLKLQKDKLLEVAEAKQHETIMFLSSEKSKLDSAIAVIEMGDQASRSDIENAAKLISTTSEVSEAQKQATEAFLSNKKEEIEAEYALYLQTLETVNAQRELAGLGAIGPNRKQDISHLKPVGYTGSGASLVEQLEAQYGVDSEQDLLKILNKQSEKYGALISGLQKITPEEMLKKAGGVQEKSKTKTTEKDFDSFFGEFDKYFNYLEKLEALSNKIANIDAKIGLESTGGAEDIALLEEKALAIANQTQVLESLIKTRKADLKLSQQEGSAKYGGFINFINDEIEVRWDLINALEISSKAEKEWYDNMLEFIDTYSSATDAIEENTNALLENQKAIEEMTQTLIDEAISTRQKLYDALVESDRRELNATKEKYDAMKEAQNDYLKAVKTAIDKERQMRSDAQKEDDLNEKRRKLAVLERDSSGLYTREAEALRGEIRGDEESLRNQSVDRQYEALQKQYELQQEQRDLEIQSLEEQIAFREETGAYWNMVDETIRNGPDAMQALLETSASYTNTDPLQQPVMSQDFADQAAKLDALFKAGQKVSVDQSSVVNMIKAGADSVANQVSKIKIPTFDTKPITEAINKLQVKINSSGSSGGSTSGTSSGGSSGSGSGGTWAIKTLQSSINKIAGIDVNVDGYTGPQTRAAMTSVTEMLSKKIAEDMGTGKVPDSIGLQWVQKLYDDNRMRVVSQHFVNMIRRYMGSAEFMPLPPVGTKYKEGGVVDYTGPAWVHGTKNKPETFLDANQTKLFAHLRDLLEDKGYSTSSLSKEDISNVVNIGDVVLNLQNPTNASSREIARLVQKEILNTFQNRLTTSIPKSR